MLQTLNITGIFKGKNFKRLEVEIMIKYGHSEIMKGVANVFRKISFCAVDGIAPDI